MELQHFFVSIFCLVLQTICASNVAEYTAAIVEYYAQNSTSKNIEQYLTIINSTNQTDFIVFPECTLTTEPVQLPETNSTALCDLNATYDGFLKDLSCASKTKQSYIIVNLDERVDCNTTLKGCSKRGYYLYNTDVIFDRHGVIIAKYRKWNLFGEEGKNRTTTAEVVMVDTDKGKFGIFTCFDILFHDPALILTKEKKVENVIFPTMWFGELPFLTALQAQQMFSYANDVNFISGASSNFRIGSGGAAIFAGKRGTVTTSLATNISKPGDYAVKISKIGNQTYFEEEDTDALAAELDNLVLKQDDLSKYSYIDLYDIPLNEKTYKLCSTSSSNKLCCNFTIKVGYQLNSIKNRTIYNYKLVAYAGERSFSGVADGRVEVCGLVACTGEDISTCTTRHPYYKNITWNIQFEKISIVGEFSNKGSRMQYPNSLLTSLRPIPSPDTYWKQEVEGQYLKTTFELKKPQNRLMTFAIYGRQFDNSNRGNSFVNSNVFLIFVAIILILFSQRL